MLQQVRKFFGNGDVALKQWFEEAMEESRYSPDIMQIESKQRHHVFLYNGLMTGFADNYLLMDPDKAVRMAVAFTQPPGNSFTMWIKKMGKHSFPVVLEEIVDVPRENIFSSRKLSDLKTSQLQPAPQARIKGELYTMRPEVLLTLDKYFENTVQFRRRRVKILVAAHHVTKDAVTKIAKVCEAWMYVGIGEYWQPLLDGGFVFQPAPIFKPEISWYIHQYYFFTLPLEKNIAAPNIIQNNQPTPTVSEVPVK